MNALYLFRYAVEVRVYRPDQWLRAPHMLPASSFFTRLTRLLTSYRPFKAGSNGFVSPSRML
jgi:hypothetical protein